jgi:hypothetical protein
VASLFDPADRRRLAGRIARLTPASPRRWGTMSSHRMLCHVADQLRLGLGEISSPPARGPYAWPGFAWLAVHVLPWPHGIKTAPALLTTAPDEFERDRAALLALMERFGARDPAGEWGAHPMFGRISGRLWGALSARHLAYHLRQFGG